MQPRISAFKQLVRQVCLMLLKMLILGNRLVGTLLMNPFSLRKLLQLLLHLWGPYSTTQCIAEGFWPTKWKMREWTPEFKKGDKQAKENYRPITVLPSLGKVFEHLLCKQITTYYDRILYSRMTAYRKQHSSVRVHVNRPRWRLEESPWQ